MMWSSAYCFKVSFHDILAELNPIENFFLLFFFCFRQNPSIVYIRSSCNFITTSQKHAYIILTPLNPLLYSKTGVYRGIHYFSCFCSGAWIGGARWNRLAEAVLTSAYGLCFAGKYEKYQRFYLKIFSFWR